MILKVANPPLARPGDTVTFQMTVTNPGTAPALSVVVTDPLPAPFIYVSASAQQGTFTVAGNLITFTVGTVNPGQTILLTIATRVRPNVVPPIDTVNTATLIGIGDHRITTDSSTSVRITNGSLPSTGEHPADDSTSAEGLIILLGMGGLAALIAATFALRLRHRRTE
jgi:uncharacterized repeat protein (TIGR01451 family)